MSTPDEEDGPGGDEPPPPRTWLERAALFVVPMSVAVVFVTVFALETASPAPDLQLLTPGGALPGRTMAVRAFLFEQTPLEGVGVRSVATRVAWRLEDADGRVAARGRLLPSPPGAHTPEAAEVGTAVAPFFGMEGVVDVPSRSGEYTLKARAALADGTLARCQAPIQVRADPRTPEPIGFPMHRLQQYALGAIEPVGLGPVPSALELRVRGGRCILGERCTGLVWVGSPPAEVRVEPVSGVGAVGAVEPAGSTDGIVRVEMPIDAPEAEVDVVASRDGADVARRRVHLPVLLGSFSLDVSHAISASPRVEATRAPAPAFIVDAYRERRWERTGSVARTSDAHELPTGDLNPGLWRIQVRTDPYGADSAAVRFVSIDPSPARALRAIRARLVAEGADDPFTRGIPHAGLDREREAEFALAPLEMDFVPAPIAMSGRMQSTSVLDENRVRARWIAGLSILAVGVFVVGFMLRRGLAAAAQARELLAAAGDRGATGARRVIAMTLTVLGITLVVGLAFVAAMILLLARG